MKTFLVLLLSALGLQASTVQFYMTNSAGVADTNYFRLIPIENPVLANGGVITRGPALRCYPAATGFFQTNLTVGWWQMTNSFLGQGILLEVPNDSFTYNATNLMVSGFNTYVMSGLVGVTSSNGSVTIYPPAGRGTVDLAASGSIPLMAGSNIVIYQAGGSNVINSTASGTGSGVTNNQVLPGASSATNFQANLVGSSNLFNVPQTLYVRTNGNDATAHKGDPSLPWLNVAAAVSAATYGDEVQVGAGAFTISNLAPSSTISIVGAGRGVTLLQATNGSFGQTNYWILATNNTVLKDFTLMDKPGTGPFSVYPIMTKGIVTNVIVQNVDLYGDSDAFAFFPGSQGRCFNVQNLGHYDSIVEVGAPSATNTWEFYDCNLAPTYLASVGYGGQIYGIHTTAGLIVKMFGGSIKLNGFNPALPAGTINVGNDSQWTNVLSGVALENDQTFNLVNATGIYVQGKTMIYGHPYPEQQTDQVQVYMGDATNHPPFDLSPLVSYANGVRLFSQQMTLTNLIDTFGSSIIDQSATANNFYGKGGAGPIQFTASTFNMGLVPLQNAKGIFSAANTVTNAQTNLFLSPSQLVGTGPQRQLADVFIGAGLTLGGSPLTLSGTGGAGGWGNNADKGTNETAVGYFVFVNPTNSSPGTNWTFFTGTNWIWQQVGTNGGGGYKTNTFMWGDGSTSNVLQILNPSGQTIVIGNTNGVWRWGTNNQMVLDTSGNLTISGQFNGSGSGLTAGSVPFASLPQIAGYSTLANPNAGAAVLQAVSTALLLDPIGNLVGGVAIRHNNSWTNSGASAVTALLSSANVTNTLNALNQNVTNALTLYGAAPGGVIVDGSANGISNYFITPSGSNGIDLYIGNSEILSLTNPLGGAALGYTIPATVNVTNKNFSTGVVHSDSNGKLTSSAVVAADAPSFVVTNDSRALTLSGTNYWAGNNVFNGSQTIASNGFQITGTLNVTNGIIQTTNTSAANQGITLDPSKNYSTFSGGAVGIGTTGITNTAAAQFTYMNLQFSTNCGWGGVQSNGTANSTLTLKGFEQYVASMGNTIVQLGDATTNLGHHIAITCGSSGTNAITTVSSQKIAGQTKWTNTAIFTCTQLISDGSNWQICGTRGN